MEYLQRLPAGAAQGPGAAWPRRWGLLPGERFASGPRALLMAPSRRGGLRGSRGGDRLTYPPAAVKAVWGLGGARAGRLRAGGEGRGGSVLAWP